MRVVLFSLLSNPDLHYNASYGNVKWMQIISKLWLPSGPIMIETKKSRLRYDAVRVKRQWTITCSFAIVSHGAWFYGKY
jgi:hypothetical protein